MGWSTAGTRTGGGQPRGSPAGLPKSLDLDHRHGVHRAGHPHALPGPGRPRGGWFRDTVPVDWDQRRRLHGIVRLYRDLVGLRLIAAAPPAALRPVRTGSITCTTNARWSPTTVGIKAGRGTTSWSSLTSCMIRRMVTSSASRRRDLEVRFDSDWQGYSDDFQNCPSTDAHRTGPARRLSPPRRAFYRSLQRSDLFAIKKDLLGRSKTAVLGGKLGCRPQRLRLNNGLN